MEQVPSVKSTRGLRRAESNMSFVSSITADGEGYDPDDPRITEMLKEHRMSPLPTHRNGETFILLLTEALMKFGAPSHRIESQLLSIAALLCIKLQVIHVPGITLLSFSKHLKESSAVNIQIVKSSTKIDLGRLYDVHSTYKRVVHYEQSAKDAYLELKSLLKRDPIFRQVESFLSTIASR
ncbi:hypothetical protein FRC19_007817 [Serendipita sp. 401]|nr:hypothetical protein FRC19_007817 [Serendipita sp. 401]